MDEKNIDHVRSDRKRFSRTLGWVDCDNVSLTDNTTITEPSEKGSLNRVDKTTLGHLELDKTADKKGDTDYNGHHSEIDPQGA